MKIIDLFSKTYTYSVEVIPNIKEDEFINLNNNLSPLFYSITWHASVHKCASLEIPPLKLAYKLRECGKNVLLHLSCDLLKQDFLDQLLQRLMERDLCNLFVVFGENNDPETSDFSNSNELIKYIKQTTGDYFCIGIAGYPQNDERLIHLKEKAESGAHFIITQACFDANVCIDFVNKCRLNNINLPILPGLFAFNSKQQFDKFVDLCKIKVSKNFSDKQSENYNGLKFCNKFITDIKSSAVIVYSFHFFAINMCDIKPVKKLINELLTA